MKRRLYLRIIILKQQDAQLCYKIDIKMENVFNQIGWKVKLVQIEFVLHAIKHVKQKMITIFVI